MNACLIWGHPCNGFHLILWGYLLGVDVTLVLVRTLLFVLQPGPLFWPKQVMRKKSVRHQRQDGLTRGGAEAMQEAGEIMAACDDLMVCPFCWEQRHPGLTFPPLWNRHFCPGHTAFQIKQKELALVSL